MKAVAPDGGSDHTAEDASSLLHRPAVTTEGQRRGAQSRVVEG